MTVRKRETRDGKSRLFIEIRYRTADGRRLRFRRDASVQTKTAALAEERRLLAELERTGTLEQISQTTEGDDEPAPVSFSEAVRHFRETRLKLLKPSTRITYNDRLDRILVPRFGDVGLADIKCEMLQELEVDLAEDKLAPSTRRNVQIVVRSVMHSALDAGMFAQMPRFPRLPKVPRKTPNPIHRDDIDAFLSKSSVTFKVAIGLAGFAGLRRSEVIGLRWSDVDLKGNVITVRRAITRGEETTPKSGKPRPIPIAQPLLVMLEGAAPSKKSPWAPVAVTRAGKHWGEFGLNQAFKRAQKRAGRSGASFHDLRHFFITELFRMGVSAPVVQQLAGHADLATTQRYADMVASDLTAAIAAFSLPGRVGAEGV